MNTNTSYRFHEFDAPTHFPFDDATTRWPTIVAEFIAPIFKDDPDTCFWFLDHGADFRVV